MTAPTPIRKRVDGRSKRVKGAAVIAAEVFGVVEASRQTGIPHQTISYWMDRPEFGELRRKTREDMAEESAALGHKVLAAINDRIAEFEPRDLTILYGVLVDKAQLLGGQPTSRTQTVTEGWEDHERTALHDAIRAELAKRVEA